jgi:hypothetical protein
MKRVHRPASRRAKKIRRFAVALVGGTLAITGLAAWVADSRETDFADPTAGITAISEEHGRAPVAMLQFRDVTQTMGIVAPPIVEPRRRLLPEDTGPGLAWGDYDADGDWDLYVVNSFGSNSLYRNDGDRFVDVADEAGVADAQGFGMGASFADYDNDGDVDLFVTNFGPNRLFRNRGDGTFEEVGEAAGVADPLWSTGAAWGDYDRDGDLDLYVCNYVHYDLAVLGGATQSASLGRASVPFSLNPNAFDPLPNRLYRNRGDGTFENVARACGVENAAGRSLATTFCDFDGDGWLDLYVANDVSENAFFRNRLGDGSTQINRAGWNYWVSLSTDLSRDRGGAPRAFADLSAVTGMADPRSSMGLSVTEIGEMTGGADGLPDYFITHWVAEENGLYQSQLMPDGVLEYRDKTRHLRLGEISLERVGWGCGFVDLGLDGRVDLLVANGSTLERPSDVSQLIDEPLHVFWNDGERFVEAAASVGITRNYSARGLAVADFDNDGDADFALSLNRAGPVLFRNDMPTGNRSLKVRLRGPAAASFGAKVTAVAGGRSQTQWFGADVSYLSMHAPELIFGLGNATAVERIDVVWGDGTTSSIEQIPAGVVDVIHAAAQDFAGK